MRHSAPGQKKCKGWWLLRHTAPCFRPNLGHEDFRPQLELSILGAALGESKFVRPSRDRQAISPMTSITGGNLVPMLSLLGTFDMSPWNGSKNTRYTLLHLPYFALESWKSDREVANVYLPPRHSKAKSVRNSIISLLPGESPLAEGKTLPQRHRL